MLLSKQVVIGYHLPEGCSGFLSVSIVGALFSSVDLEEVAFPCCARGGTVESVLTKVKLLPRKSSAFFNVSEACRVVKAFINQLKIMLR